MSSNIRIGISIQKCSQLWDSAGLERFRSAIPKWYYKEANGVLFTFDITREDSFQNIQFFYYALKENTCIDNAIIFLIGCKCDLSQHRVISYDAAIAYAESLGMYYFETQAKKNINCKEVIERMAQNCDSYAKNNLVSIQKQQLVENSEILKKNKTCF